MLSKDFAGLARHQGHKSFHWEQSPNLRGWSVHLSRDVQGTPLRRENTWPHAQSDSPFSPRPQVESREVRSCSSLITLHLRCCRWRCTPSQEAVIIPPPPITQRGKLNQGVRGSFETNHPRVEKKQLGLMPLPVLPSTLSFPCFPPQVLGPDLMLSHELCSQRVFDVCND